MGEEIVRFGNVLDEQGDEGNLHDDITENVSIIQRRNRRRSSIFAEVKKSLSENRKVGKSSDSGDLTSEEEFERRYIEELRKEKKEWLDVTKKRKQDYEATFKEYNKHCKQRPTITEEECLPYLDKEDREFLEDLPDFHEIGEKYCKLTDMHKILIAIKRRNITMGEKMLDLVSEDVEAAKRKIAQYSMNQPL